MSTLTSDMIAICQAEFANDPTGRGYSAAADDTAKAALFNNPYTISQTNTITNNARITVFWHGVPEMPNAVTADNITKALAATADVIPLAAQLLLAAEINNDPASMGYSGKTAQQQANLLNNPFTSNVTQTITMPARISVCLTQPYAPLTLTADDVKNITGV